ncbi:MAG: 1-deoxy-D-xylulose-5-phosphate synthase [Bacilli bacterium]|nr:1-deoxy-D-xylulose-5-phosphate synthase [Bacilli bacterium]
MKKKDIKRFDLDKPFNPADIKGLKVDELEQLSKDIKDKIIVSCAKNGGHLASSLGATDLTVAIHHCFNLPNDKVIFDVGHQSYAHKILSGRSLDRLRKSDGVSGFQRRCESEYDPYEAGHSSTSISAAMGLALARDLNKEKYEVIAVIGDSSLANGLAFEGLNNIANFNHKIIIIINDNNRSIGESRGLMHRYFEKFRLSKGYLRNKNRYQRFLKKTFLTRWFYHLTSWIKRQFKKIFIRRNIFTEMGLYFISNIDGHDIKQLEKAFNYAKNAPSSVVLHVTTQKGSGYKLAEEDDVGNWHGVGPFDIETGKPLKVRDPNYISWSQVYAQLLKDRLKVDDRMVLINPATMVGSCIDDLLTKYPDRVFDVGISEEHGAVFAAAIGLNKDIHAYYSIYSTFLQRSYDEISHDVARLDSDVTFLIDRAGLPGEDGETHSGIYDVAYLMSIPNVAIAMAKDMEEAIDLFNFSTDYHHPLAIRYPKDITPIVNNHEPRPVKLGEWKVETNDGDIAIISYGPVITHLVEHFKGCTIVNAMFLRPIDEELLKPLFNKKQIVIYDIYGTKEGFASYVLNYLNEFGYNGKVKVLAIPNTFIKHGNVLDQVKDLGITFDDLRKLL